MNPIRNVLQRVGESDPLLLAHHPTCEYYDHHTFELYGQKLCMGCFIVYPVGLVSLLVLSVGWLLRPSLPIFGLDTVGFYALGLALVAPKIASKVLPGARSGSTRIVGKALLAMGLALIAVPGLFRPAARLPTIGMLGGILVPYLAYKGLTLRDDCAGCPEAEDFPNCTGMTFDGAYRYPDAGAGAPSGAADTPDAVQSEHRSADPTGSGAHAEDSGRNH